MLVQILLVTDCVIFDCPNMLYTVDSNPNDDRCAYKTECRKFLLLESLVSSMTHLSEAYFMICCSLIYNQVFFLACIYTILDLFLKMYH